MDLFVQSRQLKDRSERRLSLTGGLTLEEQVM